MSLNRRMIGGVLWHRYHSYRLKSEAKEMADKLRKDGWLARVVKEPSGLKDAPFTVYQRDKKKGYLEKWSNPRSYYGEEYNPPRRR